MTRKNMAALTLSVYTEFIKCHVLLADETPAAEDEIEQGQPVGVAPQQEEQQSIVDERRAAGGNTVKEEKKGGCSMKNAARPITRSSVKEFVKDDAVPLCFELIDSSPGLVYRAADFLTVVVDQLDSDWRKKTLVDKMLIEQTEQICRSFVQTSDEEEKQKLAEKLATRLHLFCLVFEVLIFSIRVDV